MGLHEARVAQLRANSQRSAEEARERAEAALALPTLAEAADRYGSVDSLAHVAHQHFHLSERYAYLVEQSHPKAEHLIEDLEFMAMHGVGHEEAASRVGRTWEATRGVLRRQGRGDVGNKLVRNTALRVNEFTYEMERAA